MVSGELIGYREGEEAFDALVVRPREGQLAHPGSPSGLRPAVMVCHAWGGRDAFAEATAERLAALGYVGVAIDLYGIGKRGTDRSSSAALMQALTNDPPLLHRRLRAAFEAARGLDGVDPDRLGAIGFCFGGLCAILAARLGLPLRAVVSFHGLLKVGAGLDQKVRAKLLVLHGQDDPMVPSSDLAAFADEMKRVHADWQLHAYPGVMHAFTNPQANDPGFGTVYDADAARRSWEEMRLFFEREL